MIRFLRLWQGRVILLRRCVSALILLRARFLLSWSPDLDFHLCIFNVSDDFFFLVYIQSSLALLVFFDTILNHFLRFDVDYVSLLLWPKLGVSHDCISGGRVGGLMKDLALVMSDHLTGSFLGLVRLSSAFRSIWVFLLQEIKFLCTYLIHFFQLGNSRFRIIG